MKRVHFFLLLGILFFVCALGFFRAVIKKRLPDDVLYFWDTGSYNIPERTVEINSRAAMGQTFISNFNYLFMMSIYVSGPLEDKDKDLRFHLKHGKEDLNDLVTLSWKYCQLQPQERSLYVVHPARKSSKSGFHFHFNFPVIKDSKNKTFYFYFDSPNGGEAGEGIKLGLRHSGALAFRTFHTYRGGILNLLAQVKTRVSGDTQFMRFYLGCLFLISSALLITSIPHNNSQK